MIAAARQAVYQEVQDKLSALQRDVEVAEAARRLAQQQVRANGFLCAGLCGHVCAGVWVGGCVFDSVWLQPFTFHTLSPESCRGDMSQGCVVVV